MYTIIRCLSQHIHTRGQYANWDSIKDFIKTLRRLRLMNLQILVSALSFVSAFLHCFKIWLNFTLQSMRVFVAFWKKLFSFSDTNVSSDKMFSSLSSRVILFVNFLFSEKRGWMFFQKALLSVILLTSNVSKYFLRSFLYNLLQKFLCFLYFFRDSIVFFF